MRPFLSYPLRPDQYVAQVLPLNAYKELTSYFDRFMLP
jgi:hypothetical protein